MPRIAYVQGRYVPLDRAGVHIEDRGFLFADGVYEVALVLGGRILDERAHLERLARSLAALEISLPMSEAALRQVMRALVRRNRRREASLYLQITRGTAPRAHHYPDPAPRATLAMVIRRFDPLAVRRRQRLGVAVEPLPDERWRRCDVKSIALLANAMAKERAHRRGAFEAWMTDDRGCVTEGASSTAFIVDRQGVLRTRPPGTDILPSITRRIVIELAGELGVPVVERPFTIDEAQAALEAFLCSTTSFVMPVVRIGDAPVGDGRPGPLTRRLIAAHWRHVQRETGYAPPPDDADRVPDPDPAIAASPSR